MAGNSKDVPLEIPLLLTAMANGADYMQGSRFLDKHKAAATPLPRRIMARLVAWVWSLRFWRTLTDTTNGFRAYRLLPLDYKNINVCQDWLDKYELEYYLQHKVMSLGYK